MAILHLIFRHSFAATLLSISLFSSGCTSSNKDTPLPPEYDGSMMPYDFSKVISPEIPDSLTPIFIDYVGRHGARFLSSEKKVEQLQKAFEKARSEHSLTSIGKEFQELVEKVISNTDGKWGALDSVGEAEQTNLAVEMRRSYPGLLKNGTVIARATYVPRVVMSMYEFAHSLGKESPDLKIYTAEGKQFNPLLRYFTTDSAYVKYLDEKPWKAEYDTFVEKNVPAEPARRIFGDIGDDKELRKFTLDIYGVLQSLRAAGLSAPDTRWMSAEEYKVCWEAANLEHYYARSANRFSNIPAKAAIPLLQDLIADADNVIHLNRPEEDAEKAYLNFGHAETLMPLLSLCDVKGCNFPDLDASEVVDNWKDFDIVPLGANFEITILKSTTGSLYALTRLNGRNVKIGTFDSAIVPWSQLQSFWQSQITRLNN